MTLAEQLQADIAGVFMNTNDFARTVTYRRATAESEPLTAFPIDAREEVVNEEGFGTGVYVQGWAFQASALLIDTEVIVPRAGDFICETLNSVELAYEVMAPGPNQKPWQWEDDNRAMLLVWCKEVKR